MLLTSSLWLQMLPDLLAALDASCATVVCKEPYLINSVAPFMMLLPTVEELPTADPAPVPQEPTTPPQERSQKRKD